MARRSMRLSNAIASRRSVVTLPRDVLKVGRNDPCPCGSGSKYKDCHSREGEAFLRKLQRQQEKAAMREAGVPWIKRLFL